MDGAGGNPIRDLELAETSDFEPRKDDDGDPILVVIAHPENRCLGKRFLLAHNSEAVVGRSAECDIDFPEVPSLSRSHARLVTTASGVDIEDLGSTNGSFLNGRRITESSRLRSGDRLQLGAVHFKFLRERDVEAAYYELLNQLALQDGLTEVANRRRFDQEMMREFARASRHHRLFSLILFDIDNFKQINDEYGHLGGDYVLQRLAAVTSRFMRKEQIVARVGGDEFAVLNPEVAIEGTMTLAEKLRAAFEEEQFVPEVIDEAIAVTCSFGVAVVTPVMQSGDELFQAADAALYESKMQGGNRVTAAD
jgi:diguanylate cyclase (GGDEF)-like protein